LHRVRLLVLVLVGAFSAEAGDDILPEVGSAAAEHTAVEARIGVAEAEHTRRVEVAELRG